MGLSANVLWHQTNKDNLIQILKERRLCYAYAKETFQVANGNTKTTLAFPMISMCDIPLANLEKYLYQYGGYTIGISRKWGVEKGITPVWYCNKNSPIWNFLAKYNPLKTGTEIFDLLSHIKNYDDELEIETGTGKKNFNKYRFYDERELRFVPNIGELKEKQKEPILTTSQYNTYKKKNKSKLLDTDFGIQFEYEDVRYIIVRKKEDIADFKRIIKDTSANINILYIKQIVADIFGEKHNIPKRDNPNDNNSNSK